MNMPIYTLPIRPVLETAQGRGTGHTLIPFHRRLQCHVVTQRLMIVQVLIAQGNRIQALPQQALMIVIATDLMARIPKCSRNHRAQTQQTIGLSQQQHAAIRGDVTAVEISFNNTAINPWKLERFLATFSHGEPFLFSLLAQ